MPTSEYKATVDEPLSKLSASKNGLSFTEAEKSDFSFPSKQV